MKLINETKVPDQLLIDLLTDAARSLGMRIRTTNVVVKIFNKRVPYGTMGTAFDCHCVRWIKGSRRWIKTDKGAFRAGLCNTTDYLWNAERLFRTARHEWCHIHDYQATKSLSWSQTSMINRRMAYDRRPEEIRVKDYIEGAENKGLNKELAYESILNLAVWLEENNKHVVKHTK